MRPFRSAFGYVTSSYRPCLGFKRTTYIRAAAPFSTTFSRHAEDTSKPPTAFDARQLEALRLRIGKCITFGLREDQVQEAAKLLEQLGRDWRELVAGSEGYLTSKDRRGLFRHRVPWGDQDSMVSHVNNVMYNRYAESGRVIWAVNFAEKLDPANKEEWSELWTSRGDGLILRSIKTDFKFPMKFPDHITVYHKIRTEPLPQADSLILDVIVLSEKHRRPAARLVEDVVLFDYRKGKKITLDAKPFMLEAFQETYRLQEEAATTNGERARQLSQRVEALEKESWDRSDAKEDFGSQ